MNHARKTVARISLLALLIWCYGSIKAGDDESLVSIQPSLDSSGTMREPEAGTVREKYILNEVLAVVHGPQQPALILTLDLRSLDGVPRTLRDVILEQLMIFDAQKLNMNITEEDIDKYLSQLQKTQGYTLQQLEEFFKTLGFTMSEVREQLKRRELIDRIIDYRVRSHKRLKIELKDVEAEWDERGPREEATFTLVEAHVATDMPLKNFEQALKENNLKQPLMWSSPFTLKESDIAQDKRFIISKSVGEVVLIEPTPDGFDVTKLIAKTPERKVPLCTGDKERDKRIYSQIENALKQKRFEEVLREYERNLLANARIDFTYEADRQEVYGNNLLPAAQQNNNR
jgi:hypothetical protein